MGKTARHGLAVDSENSCWLDSVSVGWIYSVFFQQQEFKRDATVWVSDRDLYLFWGITEGGSVPDEHAHNQPADSPIIQLPSLVLQCTCTFPAPMCVHKYARVPAWTDVCTGSFLRTVLSIRSFPLTWNRCSWKKCTKSRTRGIIHEEGAGSVGQRTLDQFGPPKAEGRGVWIFFYSALY